METREQKEGHDNPYYEAGSAGTTVRISSCLPPPSLVALSLEHPQPVLLLENNHDGQLKESQGTDLVRAGMLKEMRCC